MRNKVKASKKSIERIAYVFQGGGALGAYQLGIFKALSENEYHPDWVIGTSIGSINGAIIAGNKPENRITRLQEFWDLVSRVVLPGFTPHDDQTRQWFNYISAQSSLLFGQPGMFSPRVKNPLLETNGSADTISYYVATPLRKTLENLVDWDLLNSGKLRFSVGAVEVQKGKAVFFDTNKHTLTPDHILASCALPPAFAAVKIDNEYFWDGGVLSNTPVQAIINDSHHVNTLCFMANLFDSFGLNPKTLDDVMKRYKDIMYSSQDRMHLQSFLEILRLRREINFLYQKMPEEIQKQADVKKIYENECIDTMMHFVRFLYTAPHSELSSKDFEFSTLSIEERINAGFKDGLIALEKSPWLDPVAADIGVAIHEICSHATVSAPW
ncbi:MAG: patatin-like phospholipase family protein [Proteobacteria bacterium]|nr:patatin-like phospholipase family protein [Pseudomonadota bacterium]